MKAVFFSVMIGYVLGSISPAYVIASVKKIDLRRKGTHNLGATNVFCTIGKGFGIGVMLFDMFKAFAAVNISNALFDEFIYAGVVSGVSAVLGHIFPFYLRFKGGKGTACLGGMIIGLRCELFIPLLIVSLIIAVIANHLVVAPVFAALVFPLLYSVRCGDITTFILMSIAGASIVLRHRENFRKIKEGIEPTIRKVASADR